MPLCQTALGIERAKWIKKKRQLQWDLKATTRFHVLTLYQTILGIESKESPSYYKIVKYWWEENFRGVNASWLREFHVALRPDLFPDYSRCWKSEVNKENTIVETDKARNNASVEKGDYYIPHVGLLPD